MIQEITLLTNWDKAKLAIAECKTIDELKQIRDKAEALRAYVKQAKESLEMQNNVAEIKLRAERRIGEFSKELPKAKNQYDSIVHDEQSKLDVLKEAGINNYQRYEAIAALPEKDFEEHIRKIKESNEELTTVGILRLARKIDINDEKKETAIDITSLCLNEIKKFNNFLELMKNEYLPKMNEGQTEEIVICLDYLKEIIERKTEEIRKNIVLNNKATG